MSADIQLSRRRRVLVLGICCLSLLIVGLDTTIVNIALPSLGRDLKAPLSGLQWTIDAYTVAIASLLILSGSMADRFGRRRVFQIGLATFTLGSLLCSIAPTLGWLIAFRVLQAVGGSMLNPVAMSIIRNVFTDPRERAQAIGIWGGVVGISMALGPVVGGLLVESVGWRSIFWINVPIGLSAIVLAALFVPESRAGRRRHLDPVGQILVIVLLGCLTSAIIEGPADSWASAKIIALFAVAGVTAPLLIGYELRRREPLIELRFFRSIPFAGATVIAVSAFAALGGFLFLNTLYLQEGRGLSPLDAGLYTLPMAAMAVFFGPLSGWLLGQRGARVPLLVAGIGLTAGSAILTGLGPATPMAVLLVAYISFGIGFAFVNPPITNTAVTGMPAAQAGVAAAIASTSRQVGLTLGVAIVGAVGVSAAQLAGAGHGGHHLRGLADASHPGWWVTTGCGLLVFALGLVTTGSWAQRTAERTAQLLGTADRSEDASDEQVGRAERAPEHVAV